MCRRIITHRMHHDIAIPMIIDPISPHPSIHANPLRTTFHRCELSGLQPPKWLLLDPNGDNDDQGSEVRCEYHSCCIPQERILYCADMLARLSPESPPERGREREREREPEPEECTLFVLEHHHERLPYLGHGNTYKGHDVVPATWRHLLPLRDETRIPFAHDESVYARWEEICFKECERLYAIQTDTRTLLESWAFMESKGFAWGRWMEDVRRDVSEAEEKLYEQRELVAGLFLWAVGECPSCLDSSGEE